MSHKWAPGSWIQIHHVYTNRWVMYTSRFVMYTVTNESYIHIQMCHIYTYTQVILHIHHVYTYRWVIYTYKFVMYTCTNESYIHMSHVHIYKWIIYTRTHQSFDTCTRVMSHISMSPITHVKVLSESCHMHKRLVAREEVIQYWQHDKCVSIYDSSVCVYMIHLYLRTVLVCDMSTW